MRALLTLRGAVPAAVHSITSSARARRVGGTSMPTALAVVRLITNSNRVGWMTGRSAGVLPVRGGGEDGQSGVFLAFGEAADENPPLGNRIGDARSVAHQPPKLDELARKV